MSNRIQRALLAAGTVLGVIAMPAAARAQKALVYCPVSIDATGCNAIVTALTGPAFPLGVDRGYDGTAGTVDLKTVDLFAYSVFVVPSLADGATSQPYATLRDVEVVEHLKAALIGRLAMWSGSPDQGTTNRAMKDALIQNLAGWASGAFSTAKGPGLVALLDASSSTTTRYDWLRAITPIAVTADANLLIYDAARALTSRGTGILTSPSGAIAYDNMATFGFQVPNGAAGVSLDAVGQTGTSQGGQVILLTADAGNASAAVVRTDKADYAPGQTVTITGSGWQPGEAVKLTLHMDPLRDSDTELMATADGNGNFTNTDFAPGQYDVGVRFVVTAVGQASGLRAQTTFTDGGFSIKTSAAGTTVTVATIIYPGTTNSCATDPPPTGSVTGSLSITSVGTNFAIPNNNQFAKLTVPVTSDQGGAYSSAATTGNGATIVSNNLNGAGTAREICIQSTNGSTSNLATLTLTYGAAAPDLTIDKSHTGNFTAGGSGSYSLLVTNLGPGTTSGTVTVTDALPAGLTATAISGTGWTCTLATLTCTRSDTRAAGQAFPAITVSVDVAINAASSLTNTASVSGGGDTSNGNDSDSDPTIVGATATTTTLSGSPNPSVVGQSVTLTASVTYGGGPVTAGAVTLVAGSGCGGSVLGGPTNVDGTGVASFTLSNLPVGNNVLTACYGGAGNFAASNGAVTQKVDKAATTTSLTSSLNPAEFGQSVTFTATVTVTAPGTGTATGTVTFKDGTTTIGTGTLDGTGKATLTTSTLSVGSHNITAEYGGDTDRLGSTSATVVQDVTQIATTTALTSAPNPSVFGQSVTFTATVTSANGTPNAGTVTFKEGATTLGTGSVDGTGKATFSTTTLVVGAHIVTAVFGGDGNFAASTSSTVTQTVNQAASATTVVSSANPSVFGQSVTFTATVAPVAPGAGTPTGSVTFTDGATALGTVALVAGSASVSTSTLTVATHTITVTYAGDANFAGSTSNALSQQVNPAPTTTAVVTSKSPSVFGENVTFTATVTVDAPGTGTPEGSVQFKDGATVLGTVSLVSGQASFSTSALSVASHSISAVYSGNATFATSTGTVTQVVDKANTTTSVTGAPNPSVFGQSVTFTATVAVESPGVGTPTGSVNFFDGGTLIGTGSLSGLTATLATSALSATTHSITAVYAGDANFKTSTSSALSQVVNKATTATALTSNANPSVFGQSVTFTATVTVEAPGAGTPTGTVSFKDGATVIGTGTLSAGIATYSTTALAVGSHSITAVYGGDDSFLSSTSPAVDQVVNRAKTTTAVTSSANPSVFGQSVTFTATISVVSPGAGTPGGTVTFTDGATTLGTGTLSGGVATVTTSALTVGAHNITATYGGDTNFEGSNNNLPQQVNKAPTATSVVSSKSSTVFGESVTFTATVSVVAPGVGTPSGTVKFKSGATELGTGTIASGQASLSTAALAVGSQTIAAEYSGDGNFDTSAGTTQQVVDQASTTTSVTSSPNPTVFGQSVTFTATVAVVAPGAGTPTGSVEFFDGATSLGTGALSGLTATLATTTLAVATHSITAVYQGNTNFKTSTSSVLSHVVDKAATSTALTSSVNPSVFGQSVTFTATVTVQLPGAGTPGGTVSFRDGATEIGTGTVSGGIATFTTSGLSVASHSITAVYAGDGSFNGSTSAAVNQVVNKAATNAAVTSSKNPSTFGEQVTLTATVSAKAPGSGTPTGNVTFKDGATTLGTAALSSGSATLSIATLAAAIHSITVVYAGDGNFESSTSAVLSQTVDKAPTTPTVTVTPSTQQYSDKVTFEATLSPAQINNIAPATGVTFKVGTQTMGTATLSVVGTQLKATLADAPLLETVAGQMAPGARTVTAEFTGVNANFAVSNPTATLTITQEDARATYTGLLFVSTPSTSTNSATITLRATIQDITAVLPADAAPGDIRKATVRFVDREAGTTLCSATLGLINAADTKTASASCDWLASMTSSDNSISFTVGIIVEGYYTRDASEDDAVVTLAKPYTGFITGGGYLLNQASSGTYAGGNGLRSNFGFNVKNNKSGSNLQGAVNIIVRSNGKVYQIKSNAISSMTATLANGPTNSGTAQFSGKANLRDITNPLAPVSLGGNLTLNMTLTDNGEPGSSDTIGFTLWDGNTLVYSSNWSGAKTIEQLLAGGNTQVR